MGEQVAYILYDECQSEDIIIIIRTHGIVVACAHSNGAPVCFTRAYAASECTSILCQASMSACLVVLKACVHASDRDPGHVDRRDVDSSRIQDITGVYHVLPTDTVRCSYTQTCPQYFFSENLTMFHETHAHISSLTYLHEQSKVEVVAKFPGYTLYDANLVPCYQTLYRMPTNKLRKAGGLL